MIRIIATIALALFLSGCGTFRAITGADASQIDTSAKALVVAASQVRAIAELTSELLDAGAISAPHAKAIATQLDIALDAINAGVQALADNGDPVAAESALQSAERSLAIALSLLNAVAPNRFAPRGMFSATSIGRLHA